MKDKDKKKAQLIKELKKLRRRINNATTNVKSVQVNRRRITDHQYRIVIDAMADAIHVVDRDLRLILFNKAFKKWNKQLQLNPDVIGKKIFDVFPFLPKHIGKEYDYIFKTGKILITEEATEIKGNKFITETRKIPILEDGDVVRIVTIIRNITERKRVEDALRESEELYRSVVENSHDGILIVDDAYRFVYVNDELCRMLGYSQSEIVGQDFRKFLDKESKQLVSDRYVRRQKGERVPPRYEFNVVRKDGKKRRVEIKSTVIKDSAGKVKTVAQLLDITERKQAESKLREGEKRFRDIADNSSAWIWEVDTNGKYTYANPAVEEILGYKPKEVLEKHFYDLFHPKDREMLKNTAFEVFAKKQTFREFINRNVHKNGQTVWLSTSGVPILDEKGNLLGYRGADTDITERKQSEDALRDSEKKYKTLTENINVGIYRNTTGPKGRFIEANPAIIKMFGYKNREEFLKIDVADLYQNSRDRKNYNKKMLRDGFVSNEEERLKKKDGASIICSVSAVAVKDDKGKVKYYDGIVEDITERKRSEQSLRNHSAQLERILEETVVALASTLGKRDPYTGGHQERVTSLACAIAKEMELSEEMIKGIRLAGLLHDIGKIATPAEILSKPSSLTDAEFNIVKYHPRIGYEILKSIEFPWPIAKIVLQHHELLDGSGYPQGLKNGEIRIEAKIMVVADVVEAMSSHRPYRPAHSLKVTLAEIKKYKGILYEPEVVDVCLGLFTRKKFRFSNNKG